VPSIGNRAVLRTFAGPVPLAAVIFSKCRIAVPVRQFRLGLVGSAALFCCFGAVIAQIAEWLWARCVQSSAPRGWNNPVMRGLAPQDCVIEFPVKRWKTPPHNQWR